MESKELDEVFRGLVLGLLGGILLFYSVRTEIPYPSWVVRGYEEPIVRMLLFVGVFALTLWDLSAAVLAVLVIMFLHTDLTMLGQKETFFADTLQSTPGKPVSVAFDESRKKKSEERRQRDDTHIEGTVVQSPFYPLTEDEEPALELGGLRPAPLL